MSKKFFFVHLLAVLLMFGLMSNAWAYTYVYTDNGTYAPSYSGDNTITYTLELTPTAPDQYLGTFTVENNWNTAPYGDDWYLAWVNFKFSSDSTATISNLSPSDWDVGTLLPTPTQVLWGGGNFQPYLTSNQAGFHQEDVAFPTGDPTSGVWLTGSGYNMFEWTFDLEVADLFLPPTGIPFQAGFFDGFNGTGENYIFNQLSETAVPEPATMLLLGSGLVGLAGFRKKFRKG